MNTKKIVRMIVSLALAVVMCLPVALPVYAASPSLSVSGPPSVKAGETFNVSVSVNDNPGIAAYKIRVAFDTSKLTLVGATNGANAKAATLNVEDPNKSIETLDEVIAFYAGARNFKNVGEYISITFEVKSGVTSGSAYISATMIEAYDQNYVDAVFDSGMKTVNISSDSGNQGNQGNTGDQTKTIALKAGADKIKYIKGYADGTFKPNQAATRYEVVEALSKVFDINVTPKDSGLTDVDAYYKSYVNLFTSAGIIDGFPDKTFGGKQSITRAQFCKIIAVMLDLDIENPKNGGFKDVSGWAKRYIDACAAAGLVKGKDEAKKLFDPNANITRAELATLVNRITGAGDSGTECKYPDVKKGTWYYGWVAAAAE